MYGQGGAGAAFSDNPHRNPFRLTLNRGCQYPSPTMMASDLGRAYRRELPDRQVRAYMFPICHKQPRRRRTPASPSTGSRPTLLRRLFQRPKAAEAATPHVDGRPPRLPEGVRAYVIGDIHGRADLLRMIERKIEEDRAHAPPGLESIVVYLGDYVDRGFESRAVLDHLIHEPLEDCRRVCLIGNHDAWLREFVAGGDVGESWLRFGGDSTLLSYGVRINFDQPEADRLTAARAQLGERLPAEHLAFIDNLELAFALGDYFFCHAGIRPDVPLAEQDEQDLLWIREPFLSWRGDIGKIVVHGHTVEAEPVVRANRIGIDTGACFTGNLTCLVLEGESYRFLSTRPEEPV